MQLVFHISRYPTQTHCVISLSLSLCILYVLVARQTFPGFLLPVLLVMNGGDCKALDQIQPKNFSEAEYYLDLGNLSVCTALSCGGRRNTPLYNKVSLSCVCNTTQLCTTRSVYHAFVTQHSSVQRGQFIMCL